MAYDPCPDCGAAWYAGHKHNCQKAATAFLTNLASNSMWETADDYPRCTWCGMGTEDWHEFMPRYGGDGDTLTITCGHCDHDYDAEVVVNYSFRIRPESKE